MNWLLSHARHNHETVEAVKQAAAIFEHNAKKTIILGELALNYRRAYAHKAAWRELAEIVKTGIANLEVLQPDFKVLKAGLKTAIDFRNGDPNDMKRLENVEQSLKAMTIDLKKKLKPLVAVDPIPSPESLGLKRTPRGTVPFWQ